MEKFFAKGQEPYGYQMEEEKDRIIAGKTAKGFRYSYHTSGIDMSSESLVMKNDGTVYYFHIYYQTKLQSESLDVWEQILESVNEEQMR